MAETAPCTHCGAVLALAQLAKVDVNGDWQYACPECAVAAPTGGRLAGRRSR